MVTIKEKIGYGFGDMASSMFWKLFGMYLMIFYTDVYGIPAAAVGTMFLITRVWDSFFDPVVGVIADRTETKWGKFRPYLLIMSIPFGVIGVLTFTTPEFGYVGKLTYAYLTYSLMMMVYSLINVPYASLLGVMSSQTSERNILSTFRMAFAYGGSFIALLLIEPLVEFFSKYVNPVKPDLKSGWQFSVIIIAVICVILFVLCFSWTKERVKPIKAKKTPLKVDFRDLLKNSPWWILLGAGISALIFNSIRDGATVYYFKYFVQDINAFKLAGLGTTITLTSLYLVLGQASNIIGVVLAAPISNIIGKKNTYLSAMSIATVLSIVFFYFGKNDLKSIFVFQFFISICAGSIFPLLWSMYADCADYSEWKTGNRATGLIFSSSSMSQKFGWTIGGALTGWLLSYFGFRANVIQTPETQMGIRMMLSFLPAIGTVLSIIFISFYPLSETRMKKITLELEDKRKI